MPGFPSLRRWLVVAMLLGLACGCERDHEGASHEARPVVRVARPTLRQVTDDAYFTGRTEAVDSVDVQARVTGYLVSIDFQPGTEVKKGQRLFLIDPRPYQAVLDEANGQVTLMEARLKLAIADYKRALEVAKTPGAISQQDIDKYAAAQDEAAAAVAAAKANCESARLNVEFTNIISPVGGQVGRNLLTLGNLIKQDQTLLATVVSQDPMYAYFDVDEQTMLRVVRAIREGKIRGAKEDSDIPVQLGLGDEGDQYPHKGTIDFVNNRLDPSTGTIQIRGEFPNPMAHNGGVRLLKPGLFVRIRLPLGDPYQAMLVPQAAVGTDQGSKYLLVVNEQSVVEYRPVTLGPEQLGGLVVATPVKMVRTKEGLRRAEDVSSKEPTLDSLQPSDRVIVGGLQLVRPGMQVETREIQADPRPPEPPRPPASIRVKDKAP